MRPCHYNRQLLPARQDSACANARRSPRLSEPGNPLGVRAKEEGGAGLPCGHSPGVRRPLDTWDTLTVGMNALNGSGLRQPPARSLSPVT